MAPGDGYERPRLARYRGVVGRYSERFFAAHGFDITAASEVMAILCLSNDLDDLQTRLGHIVVAYARGGRPIFCRDIKAEGAMTVLLKDTRQLIGLPDKAPG